MTHAVTGEENAQSIFRNLKICHAHIDGRHHFEGVLGRETISRVDDELRGYMRLIQLN
jgi:hypothetical protein